MPSIVAVLALPGVVGFDLMVPGQVFGAASEDRRRYDVRICAAPGVTETTAYYGRLPFTAPYGLDGLTGADLVLVPGYDHRFGPPPPAAVEALRAAATAGARLAAICTGAFGLAATGLLDGQRATTHWRYAAELARRHPAVRVDAAALFVDNGQFLTSAGVAAGLDLCLHLVRRDHGAAIAADVARTIVMPLQRDGGQAQYVRHVAPDDATALRPLLDDLGARLAEPLTLADMAAAAGVSVRSLHRRFAEQVGSSPVRWLLRARVQRAQHLLETTDLPMDRVAAEAGFGSAVTLRHHFGRQVGTAPQAYRTAFRHRVSTTC